MPFIDFDDPRIIDERVLGHTLTPLQPLRLPDKPGIWERTSAVFLLTNTPYNVLRGLRFWEADDDYDPYELADPDKEFDPINNPSIHLVGYEEFFDQFVNVTSSRQERHIKRLIDEEREARAVLAESGLLGNLALAIPSAVLDPLNLLPFTALARTARGISVSRSIVKGVGIGAASLGVQEAILQAVQPTLTAEESALAVGFGGLLGGTLSGAGALLSKQALKVAVRELDPMTPGASPKNVWGKEGPDLMEQRSIEVDPAKVGPDTTIDEILQQQRAVPEAVSAFGLEKNPVFKFLLPRIRGFTSESGVMRSMSNMLIMSTLRVAGATGIMPVEANVKLAYALARRMNADLQGLYAEVRKSGAKEFGRPEDFMDTVALAIRRIGDERAFLEFHPKIRDAARLVEGKLFRPWAEKLVESGLMPKELLENKAYLSRLYDRDFMRQPGQKVRFVEAVGQAIHEKNLDRLAAGELRVAPTLAKAKASAGSAFEKIIKIEISRTLPGDTPFSSAFHRVMLDVPDIVLEPWLNNNIQDIVRHYSRTVPGDFFIATRLGLLRAKPLLDDAKTELVKTVRTAKSQKQASKAIGDLHRRIVTDFGGKELDVAFRNARKDLAKNMRAAKTEKAAGEMLDIANEEVIEAFSTANLRLGQDRLVADYDKLKAEVPRDQPRRIEQLEKRKNQDLELLDFYRDYLRAKLTTPTDFSDSRWAIFLRMGRVISYGAMSGTFVFSQLNDLFNIVMTVGIRNTFKNSIRRFMLDAETSKIAAEDAKMGFRASEIVTNTTDRGRFGMEDEIGAVTRADRGLRRISQFISIANLMAPFNQFSRMWVGFITNGVIGETAARLKAFRAKTPTGALPKDLAFDIGHLGDIGLNESLLLRIADQYELHAIGEGTDRFLAPRADRWTDARAKEAIEIAHVRQQDISIPIGGPLDRPIVRGALKQEVMRSVLQFQNFGLAATSRLFLRGLAWRDARVLSYVMATFAMGMTAEYLRNIATGKDQPDLDDFILSSVKRAGFTGILFDMDTYIEAASGGQVGVAPILNMVPGVDIDKQFKIYTPQDMLTSLLGPTAGLSAQAADVALGAVGGDLKPRHARELRRMIPLNNHFVWARLWNRLQTAAEEEFED